MSWGEKRKSLKLFCWALLTKNKQKKKPHRVNKSTLWVRFLSHCAKIVNWLFQKHPLRWLQKLMRNSLWRFLLLSYLFASLIIFSVDGHQLCVLSVLVTTGAADSIYHHLNKYKRVSRQHFTIPICQSMQEKTKITVSQKQVWRNGHTFRFQCRFCQRANMQAEAMSIFVCVRQSICYAVWKAGCTYVPWTWTCASYSMQTCNHSNKFQ